MEGIVARIVIIVGNPRKETFSEALAAAYQRGADPGDVVGRATMDALVDGLTLTGGPDDIDRISTELRAMGDAGVTELGLRLYGEPAEAMRLVAERVQPALAR